MTAFLGPAEVRRLASELGVRPTKRLGQNFVHDPNTVRRIVTTAELSPDDVVLEVGPGLGSLTLALLPACREVIAVEIDRTLAIRLPRTAAEHAPALADRLRVIQADALRVTAEDLGQPLPTALVANLPYNIAVPVVLHLLELLPSLRTGLVMVQAEVADRMAAGPGTKAYGVPSVKVAYYAEAHRAATISRNVFWPIPNVDSALVHMVRRPPPSNVSREALFTLVDAAFAQRRKTLRAALGAWAGTPVRAAEICTAAGVDPGARGEQLTVSDFSRVLQASEHYL